MTSQLQIFPNCPIPWAVPWYPNSSPLNTHIRLLSPFQSLGKAPSTQIPSILCTSSLLTQQLGTSSGPCFYSSAEPGPVSLAGLYLSLLSSLPAGFLGSNLTQQGSSLPNPGSPHFHITSREVLQWLQVLGSISCPFTLSPGPPQPPLRGLATSVRPAGSLPSVTCLCNSLCSSAPASPSPLSPRMLKAPQGSPQ